MSWIRAGYPLKYVVGESVDYVYSSVGDFVEDYGDISNSGLAEILCRFIDNGDFENFEKKYFMNKVCDKLGVKLKKVNQAKKDLKKILKERK